MYGHVHVYLPAYRNLPACVPACRPVYLYLATCLPTFLLAWPAGLCTYMQTL